MVLCIFVHCTYNQANVQLSGGRFNFPVSHFYSSIQISLEPSFPRRSRLPPGAHWSHASQTSLEHASEFGKRLAGIPPPGMEFYPPAQN